MGSTVAVIPARGGSKGLPGKNIRPLHGLPLLAWSAKAAFGARCIDRVLISSEDEQIISVAQQFGCEVPFIRPAELAQDTTGTIDVLLHLLECIEAEYLVLLQPTSPLRTSLDIDACFDFMLASNAMACISVTEVNHSPYWMFKRSSEGFLTPLLESGKSIRRQDMPTVYMPNGAVYIAQTNWLKQTKSFVTQDTVSYVMPQERSVDIDTIVDFCLCESLLQKTFTK